MYYLDSIKCLNVFILMFLSIYFNLIEPNLCEKIFLKLI